MNIIWVRSAWCCMCEWILFWSPGRKEEEKKRELNAMNKYANICIVYIYMEVNMLNWLNARRKRMLKVKRWVSDE